MRAAQAAHLAALCAAARAAPPAAGFAAFKRRFGKSYASAAEERRRRAAFDANVAWAAEHAPATHGVTKFADMLPDEFRATHVHPLTPTEAAEEAAARETRLRWDGASCPACRRFPEMAAYAGDSLDWVAKGAVTPVKDQRNCDSCYAFGATGDMEGTWFLAGHDLTSLSDAELVGCVGKYNGTKAACKGGTRAKMFKWVIDEGGIASDTTYPYKHIDMNRAKCDTTKMQPVAAQFSSYQQVSDSADGEGKIMAALQKLGPISIGISAVRMELYDSGIITPTWCAQEHDHAPLIVGYGTEVKDGNATDYWKVKNSWAADWGEHGYFRIVRGQNACGLATDAVHTQVDGGPRYHCHLPTLTCTPADKGHATEGACLAACAGGPSPPPTPAPASPPTPPPTPDITRYHCVKAAYQCFEVPPGGAVGGHPSLDKCEAACFAPGYLCNATTQQCYGVPSGGSQLHLCKDKCSGAPTPVPVWTPAPPPPGQR